MSQRLVPVVSLVTALGCGLIGGVFFAFSNFVMKALARLPAAQGIRAMQSINVTVLNGWFLGAMLGTAAACAVLAVLSAVDWDPPRSIMRLAGCALYLAGTVAVTRALNVPRNDALAALDPDSAGAAASWTRYLAGWTAWNHVRTVAAVAAAALIIGALLTGSRSQRP